MKDKPKINDKEHVKIGIKYKTIGTSRSTSYEYSASQFNFDNSIWRFWQV
jgi:hypothetical protein